MKALLGGDEPRRAVRLVRPAGGSHGGARGSSAPGNGPGGGADGGRPANLRVNMTSLDVERAQREAERGAQKRCNVRRAVRGAPVLVRTTDASDRAHNVRGWDGVSRGVALVPAAKLDPAMTRAREYHEGHMVPMVLSGVIGRADGTVQRVAVRVRQVSVETKFDEADRIGRMMDLPRQRSMAEAVHQAMDRMQRWRER